MIGKKLLHYEITEKLGQGGMGVVFKARDTRLKRDVAVKFLPRHIADGVDERRRFETEAGAAAALNHPNIAHVYAIEEVEGELFIVMELVAGRQLQQVIADDNLDLSRSVNLAAQIARGLKAAHDKGIIHRDVKSANIMVTGDDQVKIMDFGLAKIHGETRVTKSGMTVGTPDYMSPEQVRGEDVDHRTDIWSFGVVLYEMLTGSRPFQGDYEQAVMYAILNTDPAPPSSRVSGLPRAAGDLVTKALARDRDHRIASMDQIMTALDSLRTTLVSPATAGAEAPPLPSVAVLPFVNIGNDAENEFFADGITEDVIAHLAKIKTLRVTSRTSAMAFKRRERTLREIGSTLGVTAIVDGSVRRARNRVRIVAQLVDPKTDENLWAETYDRDLDDIFAIQTDVALHIVTALRAELTPAERERIAVRPTRDLAAYELYLQGRHHLTAWTNDGISRAISFFERAVVRDPDFALAHAGMAHAYSQLVTEGIRGVRPEDAYRRAQTAVERALSLDDGLTDAHGILGQLKLIRDLDWTGAEAEFRIAIRLSPGNADAHDHLGWLCSSMRRFNEALELFQKAHELDPLAHRSDYANELLRAGRVKEGLVEAERVVAAHPEYGRAYGVFAWACILNGRTTEGIAALKRAVEMTPGTMALVGQLGSAYAQAGEHEKARAILSDLLALSGKEYVAEVHIAYVYAGLGEHDAAMDCLEQALEHRSASIYGINGSYLFASMRAHPRFQALLRKMNL